MVKAAGNGILDRVHQMNLSAFTPKVHGQEGSANAAAVSKALAWIASAVLMLHLVT